MRLVYILHNYPPYHNAGAETMAHQINRWLLDRGHHVEVLIRDRCEPNWEGVKLTRRGPVRWVDRMIRKAIVVTHLDETPIAEAAALRTDRPLVHILHNDRQLSFHNVHKAELIVANSAWVRSKIPDWLDHVPSLVLHPPTFVTDYDTCGPDRDSLTLVNLLEAKGGPLFYELAAKMPKRRFCGVTGAYGPQIKAPALDNLEVRPNRPDMEAVWNRTRILLAPSSYESFGKAAVEALASGIPVIAHPTEGLLESLGDAGIFVDRDDTAGWIEAIRALDGKRVYAAASKAARARAVELEEITIDQLASYEAALEALADA